jgi:hypothetical protein
MMTVRRTAETLLIHAIQETLDTVAVEIHGTTLLIHAGTKGTPIGIRATHATP